MRGLRLSEAERPVWREAAPHPALRATFSPCGEHGEKKEPPFASPLPVVFSTGRGQGEGLRKATVLMDYTMDKKLENYAEIFRQAVSNMALEQINPVIGAIKPKRDLGRIGLECFMAVISIERFELLKALRRNSPLPVSGLARVLKRSENEVQSDVAILLKSALLSRTDSGLVEVTWDHVTATLDLMAA